MKKIYYLQKNEVKLGDAIEYNGIKALVTKELIELNPELFSIEEDFSLDLWAYIPSIKKEPFKLDTQPMYFKCIQGSQIFTKNRIYEQTDHISYPDALRLISDTSTDYIVYDWQSIYKQCNHTYFELTTKEEWDKQELLDKAKRDYPAGTMFNSEYGIQKVLDDNPFVGILAGTIQVNTDRFTGGATIYTIEDGWAEILPLKFTTKDGVDIYGDMKTYLVHPNDNDDITFYHSIWNGGSDRKGSKYFYHKENALAYIGKPKEKTLEDYENILFEERGNSLIFSSSGTYFSMYGWLKDNEPKLYYTKILQLIADDLNDGWVADSCNQQQYKYYLSIHYKKYTIERCVVYISQGAVLFNSIKLVEKAIDILGEKIEYI